MPQYTIDNWWGHTFIGNSSNYFKLPSSIPYSKFKVLRIGLRMSRGTNNNYPYYINSSQGDTNFTGIIPQGQIVSSENFVLNLTVGDKTSNNCTITTINEFKGVKTGIYQGQEATGYTKYDSWIDGSTTPYIFEFTDPPIIETSEARVNINFVSGYLSGNRSVLAVRPWSGCYVEVEDASAVAPVPSKTHITLTNTSGSPLSVNGVLKTSTETITYTGDPGGNITYTGNTDVSIATDYINKTITISAINNNTDYGTINTITANCANGTSFNLFVDFYETIKRDDISISIEQTALDWINSNKTISIKNVNYNTAAAKAHCVFYSAEKNSTLPDTTIGGEDFTINSNTTIDISNWFDTNNNNGRYKLPNIPNLEAWCNIFRFYNSNVQTKNSDGNYKQDKVVKFYLSVLPTLMSVSSAQYDVFYKDTVVDTRKSDDWNNPSSDLPAILDIENYSIGNIMYNQSHWAAGFCNCCEFVIKKESNNEQIYSSEVDLGYLPTDKISNFSGKLLNIDFDVYDIPKDERLNIYISWKFKFYVSKESYTGFTIKVPYTFMRFSDDILPKVKFPIVNKTKPYSNMMLTNVERFGYEFSDSAIERFKYGNYRFGLNINGTDVYLNDTYFSSNNLTKCIIFDAGKYVKNTGLYVEEFTVKPFVMLDDTRYEDDSNIIIECTTLDTMWTRPFAEQGESLTYFDYNNFNTYIKKYSSLNEENPEWSVPTEMRGRRIEWNFWKNDVETYINEKYVNSMINWLNQADNINNNTLCWIESNAILFKQGTKIQTNIIKTGFNNLKENFYDILNGLCGYEITETDATYDYINNKGYTHDFLHGFTHNQITNKEGGI